MGDTDRACRPSSYPDRMIMGWIIAIVIIACIILIELDSRKKP